MVKCTCEDMLSKLKVFMENKDKDIEGVADEDHKIIAQVKTETLLEIREKMSNWNYCNCYSGKALRKVKQIIEYNFPCYKENTIPLNQLDHQYSVIKQTIRGTV